MQVFSGGPLPVLPLKVLAHGEISSGLNDAAGFLVGDGFFRRRVALGYGVDFVDGFGYLSDGIDLLACRSSHLGDDRASSDRGVGSNLE